MLGYPECDAEIVFPKSVLYRLEDWSMGQRRSFSTYTNMVGIDYVKKTVTRNGWCHHGQWPTGLEVYKTK